MADVAAHLPPGLGVRRAVAFLGPAGTHLSPLQTLAAFVPASLYAEGLVRSLDRLSVRGDSGRRTLRARVGSVVLVPLVAVLAGAGLAVVRLVLRRPGSGTGHQALSVYLSFLVGWLVVSGLLAAVYRGLAPERPGLRAVAWGSLTAGSVVAGTGLGFLVLVALAPPLGAAYGGATSVAAAALGLLWLEGLHALVLVGYLLTLTLAARRGHPAGPVVDASAVRDLAPSGG